MLLAQEGIRMSTWKEKGENTRARVCGALASLTVQQADLLIPRIE